MKNRLAVFICICLLALVLVGCAANEESSPASSAPQTQNVKQNISKENKTVQEIFQVDNASVVVPARDPFVPLIKVSSSNEVTTKENQNTSNPGNKNTTTSNNNTNTTDEQQTQTNIELVSVYQQDGKLYASLKSGNQLTDATVGDTFNGYQVVAIDLQKNQVTLALDGKTVVLNNNQFTK
ncbi:MAG: hypothetical protein ACOX8A_09810 [Thermacetogeniaceae bacterium]|jgi:type IV pilus biogenesis protein PilP